MLSEHSRFQRLSYLVCTFTVSCYYVLHKSNNSGSKDSTIPNAIGRSSISIICGLLHAGSATAIEVEVASLL